MKNNSGFALVTIVILTWLLFGFATSYMGIMVQDKYSTLSTENQIKAMAIAEAGIDGALWIYNYGDEDFDDQGFTATGDGWELVDEDFDDADGNTIGTRSVTIDDTSDAPNTIITSTGTVEAAGADDSKTVTVSAAIKPVPLYEGAIVAKGRITIDANIDSYTSPTAYGGANISDNGDVLTNSSLDGPPNDAIEIGTGDTVNGDVGTGSGGVAAGDYTGSSSDSINNEIPDVEVTQALIDLGDSSTNYSMNGGSAPEFWSGNYRYNSLSMSGSSITITGPTEIYLDSTSGWVFSTSGTATIIVNTTLYPTASLKIYTNGNVNMTGTGILNTAGSTNPQAVQILGTSTCGTVNISGNSAFAGLVNTPYADVTVSGSSEFYGAIIADTADINQPVHYDENLITNGPSNGYALSWARRT